MAQIRLASGGKGAGGGRRCAVFADNGARRVRRRYMARQLGERRLRRSSGSCDRPLAACHISRLFLAAGRLFPVTARGIQSEEQRKTQQGSSPLSRRRRGSAPDTHLCVARPCLHSPSPHSAVPRAIHGMSAHTRRRLAMYLTLTLHR